MEFRFADTFTDSLARLTGDEQKAAKTAAFDLQLNPASPGLSFHKLDQARDKNFWSLRASSDLRLIVHRSEGSVLLCYVDHHDKAYAWAERRKLETHPQTGAAQLVEIRETVREIVVPNYVEAPPAPRLVKPEPALFALYPAQELLGYGVPEEWLADVQAATESTLLGLVEHLPAEAAEALLELATGGKPPVFALSQALASPFDHPNAQRRFRLMTNPAELEQALEAPWDKWTIFLHPDQQELVARDFGGPARVAGSAGTGKTVVALHRAVQLAQRNPDARVLLTTFSEILAGALRIRLRRLVASQPRLAERIDVSSLNALAFRLHEKAFGAVRLADRQQLMQWIAAASEKYPERTFSRAFLLAEWQELVDAWQLRTWADYRSVKRLGRKVRLPETQRMAVWAILEQVWQRLGEEGLTTVASVYARLSGHLASRKTPLYDFVVVDESQDLTIAQLRFLAELGAELPNGLFFAGDQGQRIFQQPFSWLAAGIDIRGRSRTLRVNYRTSHQIRRQADRLLPPELSDVDGELESRRGTVSVFNGPEPRIELFADEAAEVAGVAAWLAERRAEGMAPHELGVFVRSPGELERAQEAVKSAGLSGQILDQDVEVHSGKAAISTMHLAKGLEFRAVAVMACDDDVLPSPHRLESVVDESDLEEVYNTERHLLYVACTRARDQLLVTAVAPGSEFLADLKAGGSRP